MSKRSHKKQVRHNEHVAMMTAFRGYLETFTTKPLEGSAIHEIALNAFKAGWEGRRHAVKS